MTVVAGGGFRQLSVVKDGFAEQVNMGGGVTNLLRMARNECRGLVTYIAAAHDGGLEVASFPEGGVDAVGPAAVSQLVRLTSSDPEFGHGGPFVRTVVLDGFLEPVTVAVAPLGTGGDRGLLGVVGHDPSDFGEHQRRTLERVAQRLTRHLVARDEVDQRRRSLVDGQQAPPVSADTSFGTPSGLPAGFVPGPPATHMPHGAASPTPGESAWESTEPVVPPWAEPRPPSHGPLSVSTQGGFRTVVPPVRWSVATPPDGSVGGHRATPTHVAPPAPAPADEPVARDGQGELYSPAWEEADGISGLPGLGSFFSRTGRIMGGPEPRAVAMVVLEVEGTDRPEELVVQLATSALRTQLRTSDPLARIGRCAYAAAVALEPGSSLAPVIEQRLAGAVRGAVVGSTSHAAVRSAHVLVEPEQRLEADELLRRSLRQLHGI
ncbi:MAG: hypothetical protein ACLP62_13060 [Acidimicrobiales bacterium]